MRDALVALYEGHPVDADQILDDLLDAGRRAEGLEPSDLFPFDQDHYGGVEATEALALSAGIGADDVVLDLCSGLGGPARYVAWRFGCAVTGIDLVETRVEDARRLTAAVGLDGTVDFRAGDAIATPFPAAAFTVCLSQESFLHIADKPALFAECRRILRPGGTLAFSDWARRTTMSAVEHLRLEHAFTAGGITGVETYLGHLRHAGFERVEVADITELWKPSLRARLERIHRLRGRTVARFGEEHYVRWEAEYAFMVDLVHDGKLGGARFVALAD